MSTPRPCAQRLKLRIRQILLVRVDLIDEREESLVAGKLENRLRRERRLHGVMMERQREVLEDQAQLVGAVLATKLGQRRLHTPAERPLQVEKRYNRHWRRRVTPDRVPRRHG